jgi:hypothetical protein
MTAYSALTLVGVDDLGNARLNVTSPGGARVLAEDNLAETLAHEVIRSSTDFDGTERAPMRTVEARITLGVLAARQGDIEAAFHQGERRYTVD